MTTDTRTSPDRNRSAVFVFSCAAAALFFIINIATISTKSLWVDEMRTGFAALAHTPRELFRYLALNDPVSPLFSLISAATCKFMGISELTLRLPALLFATASILAFSPLAARFLKKESAVVAVFLLAASPNLIGYSQEARAYTAFLFFSLLAFRLIIEFNETRAASLKLSAVFAAGMFTHTFFAFVILNCVLYAFMFNSDKSARLKTLACVVVAVVAFAPWMLAFLRLNTGAPERLPGPELTAFMKVAFVFGGLIIGNSYIDMGLASIACVTGIALWLYGTVRMLRDSRREAQIVLLWTFAPITAALIAFAVFTKIYDMFHFRYVIFALPLVLAPIAAGAGYFIRENITEVISGEGSFAGRFKAAWLKPAGAMNIAAALLAALYLTSLASNVKAYYKTQNQDWRGALKYIHEYAEPGDTVVLHSIADSSVKFYAMTRADKYNFAGTNSINEIVRIFAVTPRTFFVYYRPRFGLNMLEKTQKSMDSLAQEKAVFPGLYGDVVVGRSEGYTLANEFSLVMFERLPADMTEHADGRPAVMKQREREFNRRRYTFFNIKKGTFEIRPTHKNESAIREEEKEGRIPRHIALKIIYDGNETYVGWANPTIVTLERGAVDVDVLSPEAGFTIKRKEPIKFVDEGTGPEFRGYFLDWIRK